MDTAWIALIGTLMGGAGLKTIESILGRAGRKQDHALNMREELRKDSDALKADTAKLREEIRSVERELDAWKEKYFVLLQEYLEAKSELTHRRPVPRQEEDW